MKTPIVLSLLICICGCNNTEEKTNKPDSVIVVEKKPLINPYRTNVSKKPVKVWSKPIANSDLQGEFAVRLYETEKTFHYLMRIRYAEFTAEDTLRLPNFGVEPQPEIRKYSEPNACIVGFYDAEKNFKEYKLVQVKNNNVKIKALKHYAVATYREKM